MMIQKADSRFRVFVSSLFLLVIQVFSTGAASPIIVVTNTPPFGTFGNLQGYVRNVNPATNSVAVFIFVAGGWYSKPYCASQLTTIQSNGSWSADITTVPSDTNATEIAAVVVPSNYSAPCGNGTNALVIPADALAEAYVIRTNPAVRQLKFSGYTWSLKSSGNSLGGPGPNYFTDSTNNSWVDALGYLHLKITYTNGEWLCPEIINNRSLGYGQYRFSVNSPVSVLGSNVVLGMFTWSDDAAYNYREIDIEQSRWEYAYGPNDVEDYAISPYNYGQTLDFSLPVTITNSTHSFTWQSTNVAYQSLNGRYVSPPAATNILATWNCALGVPPAGGEQVHINLWLDNGTPPQGNQSVEVVMTNFTYVPLGPPPIVQWQGWQYANASFQAIMTCVPEWHYVIQSSSDLVNWTDVQTVIPTDTTYQFIAPPMTAVGSGSTSDGTGGASAAGGGTTNAVMPLACFFRIVTLN